MDNHKVYADLTFIINFIMDFLILWMAGRLSDVQIKFSRLVLGAIVGGLYAVGNLFSVAAVIYSWPSKILFALLLVILSLRPSDWHELKKAILVFYALSIIAAGSTIAACYLFNGSNGEISYIWLPVGILTIMAIGYYGADYLETSILPDMLQFTVKVCFGGETCSGEGFLDTGNSLRDPATNRPVVVAEYQFMEKILPQDLKQVISDINTEGMELDALIDTSWANRLRLIPFSSIGKKNGLLIGVRSDAIVVSTGKKNLQHSNVVIGLYQDSLSRDGKYQMLIPSEMLKAI